MSVPDDVNIGKEDKREENVKEKMKKKEKERYGKENDEP
jgi:hypothetical protein